MPSSSSTLTIKKVGDMRLLEAGLLSQPKTGETALVDPLPKGFAKVVLQHSEFHSLASIPLRYSNPLFARDKISTTEVTQLGTFRQPSFRTGAGGAAVDIASFHGRSVWLRKTDASSTADYEEKIAAGDNTVK